MSSVVLYDVYCLVNANNIKDTHNDSKYIIIIRIDEKCLRLSFNSSCILGHSGL